FSLCTPLTAPLFPYTTLFRSVEVRRMSTSVGASRRASSTVSMSSLLSPLQTTAFIVFPFFLQTLLSKNFSGFLYSVFFMPWVIRSEEHTSELQSHLNLVCRLL